MNYAIGQIPTTTTKPCRTIYKESAWCEPITIGGTIRAKIVVKNRLRSDMIARLGYSPERVSYSHRGYTLTIAAYEW